MQIFREQAAAPDFAGVGDSGGGEGEGFDEGWADEVYGGGGVEADSGDGVEGEGCAVEDGGCAEGGWLWEDMVVVVVCCVALGMVGV